MSNRGKRIMRELPILFNKEMVPQEKTPEGVFNRGSGIRTHDHAFIGELQPIVTLCQSEVR